MGVGHETGIGHDSEALVRIAGDAGYQVSLRMLETFRAQGLLPRPVRTGHRGRTPVWTYSDGAHRQLIALLGWREHTKDLDTLRVLLWVDGFPLAPDVIRAALVDGLTAALDMLKREITTQAQRHGLAPTVDSDRDQALHRIAGGLTAKRGPNSLPRRTRVRAADRAQAVHLLLRAFALGDAVHATAEDAKTVERVLGVAPNGRRQRVEGAGPWLTGPAEALFETAEVVALPTALRAVREATEAEMGTARDIVAVLFRHLPLVARMMAALFDDANYAGLAGLDQIDQHPEIVMLLVPSVIGMLRAGWQENLQAVTVALGPMPDLAAQARSLLDQPHRTIEANLSQQPPDVRKHAQRIIDATMNGAFDRPQRKPPAR
ncbi:hypothetical protein [Actinokineospora fastidiosa]|uniref:Uncharacterized protein n=1 Tax=Actinokineospora fastidiosa TaxID=1816 RepID=A0A918GS24_9PSEU|nr:hypothetical protein [Actinokineospora fastidiosa]GGS54438.1 hypothetical protein GCM10010171_56970 [Actinokineospora fastidiosa]